MMAPVMAMTAKVVTRLTATMGSKTLRFIVNGQQIDQDEHEQVFKRLPSVWVLKKVRHARDELMNKDIDQIF